jgi:iron complex transport system substrate-binding protein
MKVSPVIFVITLLAIAPAIAQHRIITAGSAITESVCALGDCDKIIASDRTSLYPSHIQSLPSIGYRGGISAEGIISLKPTLVIAEKDYVDAATLEQLAATGIALLVVEQTYDFAGTRALITKIGSVLSRAEEAKALIAANEKHLAEAKVLLHQITRRPRVLCVYNRGTETVSIAGDNSFGNILDYAGVQRVPAGVSGYKTLNAEALIAANPDYLVMTSTGFQSMGGLEGVLRLPGVALTNAGRQRQIVPIESLRLTNFGPRFGETVKELVLSLHPELLAK